MFLRLCSRAPRMRIDCIKRTLARLWFGGYWGRAVDNGDKNKVGTLPGIGKMPTSRSPQPSGDPMAGSVNKVILVGNLGRDPEIRSTQDGTRIANLRLATSENWRDRATGERKERTEWHSVAI